MTKTGLNVRTSLATTVRKQDRPKSQKDAMPEITLENRPEQNIQQNSERQA